MKVLLVALACVAVVSGAATLNRMKSFKAEGPTCPYPPEYLLDPAPINLTIGELEVPGVNIIHIAVGSEHHGGLATGLHNLYYSFDFNAVTLKLTFQAEFPDTFCAKGDSYQAEGQVDATPFTELVCPTGPFTGTGAFDACITDAIVSGSVDLRLNIFTGVLSITDIILDVIRFAHANVDLSEFLVNNELVDWAGWSADLKENFDKEWPLHGQALLDRLKGIANTELGKTTLEEILEWIENLPEQPPCMH